MSYRAAPVVRDPAALALFTAASRRGVALDSSPTASSAAGLSPASGPMGGVIAAGLAVIMIVAPVALAATGSADDRCTSVPYVLDARLGPPAAEILVRDVLDEVEEMSGVRFVRAADDRRGAPVRVAWVSEPSFSPWARLELGRTTVSSSLGPTQTPSGEVLLRSLFGHDRIEGDLIDWRTVTRHEVGHLMGLPHRPDPRSVMHPILTTAPHVWTDLDRSQLAERGRAAGCKT